MKMEEKYIRRRTIASVLIMQAYASLGAFLFLYGIMH